MSQNPARSDAPSSVQVFSPKYRAYILGVLFVTYLFNYMDRSIIGILMPQIKSELHLHDWQIGILAGAAFSFFYAVAALPISYVVDRSRRVTLLTIAVSFWSVMTALCGLAGGFWQLLIARAGVGLGEAGSAPCASTLISDLYGRKARATAFGIYNAGISFGGAAGLIIGSFIASEHGWRAAFIWVGLPGLLVAAVLRLTVKEPPRGMSEPSGTMVTDAKPVSVHQVARVLFSTKLYRHYVTGASLSGLVTAVSLVWAPSFLIRSYHLDLKVIGLSLAVMNFIGGVAGNAAGGYLADRLAGRGLRWRFLAPAIAMVISAPFIIVGYSGLGVVVTLLCWGISKTAPHTITGPGQSTVQELVGLRMRGTAHALNFFTITMVSGVFGPLLVGAASDMLQARFGEESLRIALMGTAVCALWSAFHFFMAARHVATDLEPVAAS